MLVSYLFCRHRQVVYIKTLLTSRSLLVNPGTDSVDHTSRIKPIIPYYSILYSQRDYKVMACKAIILSLGM